MRFFSFSSNPFSKATPEEAPAKDPIRDRRTALMASVSEMPLNEDAFGLLNESIRRNQQMIQMRGEEAIRHDAAILRTQERMDALLDLDLEEELGAPIAMADILNRPIEDRSRGALESRYTAAVQTGAQMMTDQPDNEDMDFWDISAEREAKHLIWARHIDNVWQERRERPWLYGLSEMLLIQGIPARNSMTQTGTLAEYGLTQEFWDNIFAGGAVREESAMFHDLMEEMTVEEFDVFAEAFSQELRNRAQFGPFTDLSMLQQIMEELLDAPPELVTNVINGVDNVPLVSGTVRAVSTLPRTLARTGSRRAAADAISNALGVARREGVESALDTVGGVDIGDLAGPVSPSSINPWGGASTVSLSESVADRMTVVERLLNDLMPEGTTRTARLSPEDLERARESALDSLQTRANREAVDHDMVERQLSDGTVVNDVVATFGRSDGDGGYSSLKAARRAAAERGFNIDADDQIGLFQDEAGGWFFRASVPVRETGFYAPLQNRSSNSLSRWFLSGTSTSDISLGGSAVVAEGTRARVQREVIRPFADAMRRVPRREREAVAQIWQRGNNEARWYTEDEFGDLYRRQTGSAPSAAAWDAYRTVQLYNDLDWMIRNDSIYKQLQTEGYEDLTVRGVNLNLDGETAQVVSNPRGQAYDISTGTMVDVGDLDEGLQVVRIREGATTDSGWKVQQIVGPRGSFEFRPLRRNQLAYREGGHRMPQGNWFVKQAQRWTQPDGSSLLTAPRALIAARNAGEARVWARTMEEVRQVLRGADNVRDPAVIRQLNELIEGRRGFPSVERLLSDVENGKFNLDDAFEVVEDRALPSAYYGNGGGFADGLFDAEEATDVTWGRTHGTMYYGRKGEDVLPDWQGGDAPTLDMMQVMQRSLANVSNLMALSDYKRTAVERFNDTYGRYLTGSSASDRLFRGQVIPGTPPNIAQGLEANRRQIQRILNTPTKMEEWTQRMQRQLSAYVAGEDPTSWRYRTTTDVAEWWSELGDPVNALRGAAFDMKLGLFNVAQFPLQISTMLATATISPKANWAASIVPAITFGRISMANPRVIDTLVSRGAHELLGMDASDFREWATSLRRSGFFRIGGNHALMEDIGPSASYATTGGMVDSVREGARFFFNEAETFNRMAAGHIAWRETREALPGVAADSAEFQARWLRRTDDYSLNMSNASRAEWQRGALSIPTQFWSYSVRMMEAMLGPRFSAAQKTRLLLGQTLLYGAAGIPAASLAQYVGEQFGLTEPGAEPAALNTLQAFYERGLVDHMINWTTGLDVRASERIGVGQLPEQIVRDIFNDAEYGDTSAASIVGGATFSIWNDVAEDVWDIARYAQAEAGNVRMPMTRDALIRLGMNWSGGSNLFKAYMIDRYGVYVSGSGTRLASDLPDEYAFAAILSVQPQELERLSGQFDYLGKDDEIVDELAGIIRLYRQRMLEEPDRRQVIYEEMAQAMQLFEPHIVRRARRQVGNYLTDSLASSVSRQTIRRQAEEAISEAVVEESQR